MFCHRCGREIGEHSIFCPKCGVKIAIVQAVPMENGEKQQQESQEQISGWKMLKNHRLEAVAAIIVLVILMIGNVYGGWTRIIQKAKSIFSSQSSLVSVSPSPPVPPKEFLFSGYVMNSQNRPVPEAIVKIKGTEKSTLTDYLGYFEFKFDAPPPLALELEAHKTGYVTYTNTRKNGATIPLQVK